MKIQFEISEKQLEVAKFFMMKKADNKFDEEAIDRAIAECESETFELDTEQMGEILGDGFKLVCITVASTVLYQVAENNGDIRK